VGYLKNNTIVNVSRPIRIPAGGTARDPAAAPEPLDVTKRALLISNQASGANMKLGLAGVEAIAAAAGLAHYCVDDMETLDSVLVASAARGDRLVIINAGDGTVSRVLQFIRESALFPVEPELVLLRGGTTNMIHNDVGIPGKPDIALRKLLDALAHGGFGYSERRTLRIARTSCEESSYGFFFGTHAATKAILRARTRFHGHGLTGRVSEFLAMAMMIWRLMRRRVEQDPILAPVTLEIRQDGGPWRRQRHILLMALSVRSALLGIRPLKRGQGAGLAVLSWPDYRLFRWLGRSIRGTLKEFDSLGLRGRFDWILDGEVHEHHPCDGVLEVSVDKPARFLVLGSL